MKLLNFGSLNIDYVYRVGEFTQPEEKTAALSVERHGGGKGFNQSIALARAGAKVSLAGAIGRLDGGFLRNILEKEGIDTTFLAERTETTTGHAIVQVNPLGENSILLHGGANQSITPQEIHYTLSEFQKGDVLFLQNEINEMDTLIREGINKGMRIVLNPSPISRNVLHFPLDQVEYFALTEGEARYLAGVEGDNYLDKLLDSYPQAKILMIGGAQGALYADQNKRISHRFFKTDPIDRTGVNDTFIGYFFACLFGGGKEEEALKLACKAAALASTKKGAATSIPTMEEVKKTK